MASYLEQAIAKLKEFEGSVPWMYLDTVGKVTVGVGLMLPNLAAAQSLPFVVGGRAATPEEIGREYDRVSALAKGKVAAFYKKEGGLRLAQEAMDERLGGVLAGMEEYLRAHVPGYPALPDSVKIALLDMVYNLGPGRLFQQFPRLISAVGVGDWKQAAAMSSRRGPGAARNDWTRDQFLAAAKQIAIKAEAEVERAASGWIPALAGAGAMLLAIWATKTARSSGPSQTVAE